MVHIFHPLSGARRNKASSALLSKQTVHIGGCILATKNNQITGTDINGNRSYVADSCDRQGVAAALRWVETKLSSFAVPCQACC